MRRPLTDRQYTIVYWMAMADLLLAEVLIGLSIVAASPFFILGVVLFALVLAMGPRASRL